MLKFFLLSLSLALIQQTDSLQLLSTITLMTRAFKEKHTLRISVIIYGSKTLISTHGLPANAWI